MRRAATVLILGDPGPLRDEILLRKEIDVVWSESFADARELLAVYDVDACIIAREFERAEGYERFRDALGAVPCLVQRRPGLRGAGPEAQEPVLHFLARHTGLVFARFPRVDLQVPVTLEAFGEKHELLTHNLSVSGVAVADAPDLPAGTRVELCIELPEAPVYLIARVVRTCGRGELRTVGLSFTDLHEGVRRRLARAVEDAMPRDGQEPRLFGELEVPLPDVRRVGGPSRARVEAPPAVERAPLAMRRVREPEPAPGELPDWFDGLGEDLTELERLAALGLDAPEWAHRVLRLRIELARARSRSPGGLPLALRDEAYRTFAGLEEQTMDAPLEVREQVSSLRASLLRDVLGDPVR